MQVILDLTGRNCISFFYLPTSPFVFLHFSECNLLQTLYDVISCGTISGRLDKITESASQTLGEVASPFDSSITLQIVCWELVLCLFVILHQIKRKGVCEVRGVFPVFGTTWRPKFTWSPGFLLSALSI